VTACQPISHTLSHMQRSSPTPAEKYDIIRAGNRNAAGEQSQSYTWSDPKMRIILEAGRRDREYAKDLWRYRELFYVLAWRDVSVRYKQTAIGIIWAVIRPALTTLVFTVVFGRLGKFPSGGTPYPVLVLSGILPWQLFSAALSESSHSLIANSNLITKVYFPRLIIPGSTLVVSLIDFAISLILLAVLMAIYHVAPSWNVFMLPVFVLLALVTVGGMGAWISALTVRYRDFSFIVPFITQLGLYVSPVGFSSRVVPEKWHLLYALNPMVGVIDGFRWCILGRSVQVNWVGLALSTAVALVVAVSGFAYFRGTERTFADVI
jgi:lipopolysaccharide transport system permease protein